MSIKIKRTDISDDIRQKTLAAKIIALDEEGVHAAVSELIRKKYPISKELSIHRKKLMGIIDNSEWSEYCNYVIDCIAQVEDETSKFEVDIDSES